MKQRLVALVVAAGMITAAVVIRGQIDDDGADEDATGDGSVQLICAYDLVPVCDGIDGVEIVYQAAATTAEFIVEGSPQVDGVDGWVTTSAWLEVVEARRPGRLPDEGSLLARTTAIVAVEPARTDAVRALCSDASLWRCLGDNAGRRWGDLGGQAGWGTLRTGLPDADSSSGLPVIASVAAGYFDATDFARNDFDASDFRAWLSRLAAASGEGEGDPILILAREQGKYTAVGDRAASVLQRGVDVLEPDPSLGISAVAVSLRGDDLPDLGSVREGLEDFGWTPANGPLPGPTLKPGVMAALHTLWTEVTG